MIDIAGGFDTGFSFYYAANRPGEVDVYSGLDGTGTLLASVSLSTTLDAYYSWVAAGVSFAGTAESAVFTGTANYITFDNITFGSATPGTPGGVPEVSTWAMMLLGFASLGYVGRLASRKRTQVAA